jgi:hypothetical protein
MSADDFDLDFFAVAGMAGPSPQTFGLPASSSGTAGQTSGGRGACMCVCKSGAQCSRAAKTEFNNMRMCNIHYNMLKTREDSCSICLDPMTSRNYTKLGACGHLFHTSCIVEWGSHGKETCPCCRKTMCPADIVAINQKTTDYIGSIIFSLPSKDRRDIMLKNVMDAIIATYGSFHSSDVARAMPGQTGQLRLPGMSGMPGMPGMPQTAQSRQLSESRQDMVEGSDDEDLDGDDEDDVDRDPDFVPTMIDVDV